MFLTLKRFIFLSLQCNKKYPTPTKSHYGPPPKPLPSGSYGAPLPKPPLPPSGTYGPPTYPVRKQGTTSKGTSFSPFKDIMAAIEPYLPGGGKPKPQKGASYLAPNPAYAPLLPSYQPAVPKPYVPQQPYVPKPVPLAQKVDYVPKPTYVNPVRTYTVTKHASQPTVVEHHSHTHTHIYKGDQTPGYVQDDPYYPQGSKQVFKRQHDSDSVKFEEPDSIQDILNHEDQRQETRVRVTSSVSSSTSSFPQGTHVPFSSPSDSKPPRRHIPSGFPSSHVPQVPQHSGFRPGKVELGFKPMNTVPNTFFRQEVEATYLEDCQCVQVDFCDAQDVVLPFTSDIRQFLDARTKGSDILSNATNENATQEDAVTLAQILENASQKVAVAEKQGNESPIRRGRVLGLSAKRVYVNADNETVEVEQEEEAVTEVTEATTEEETEEPVTEAESITEEAVTEETQKAEAKQNEEESRVRRDVPTEEDAVAVPSDRQGVSITKT